jgi:hypothetical protein
MYITQNYTKKRRKTNSVNGGEKGGQGKEGYFPIMFRLRAQRDKG